MAYSAPATDAVDFSLEDYTAASTSAVDFEFQAGLSLSGTIPGSSSLSAPISITRGISGTSAGVSSLSASLSRLLGLTGTLAGVGSLSGTLLIGAPVNFAGTTTGQSSLSGILTSEVRFIGTSAGVGSLSGDVSLLVGLSGTTQGQLSVSALLTDLDELLGTIAGTGSVSGAISVARGLTGQADGVSSISAILSRIRHIVGSTSGQLTVDNAKLLRTWKPQLFIDFADSPMRLIQWDAGEQAILSLDGEKERTTDEDQAQLPENINIRQYIRVQDEMPDTKHSPFDEVQLEWTGTVEEGGYFRLERKLQGEADSEYSTVIETTDKSYIDGPLADETYDYRVITVDAEGDEAISGEQTITVSSAPDAPSNISYSLDSGTLTIDADASPSDDIDHYAVYLSGSEGKIELHEAPDYTPSSLPIDIDVSSTSGILNVLVRAVDSDGKEEANISQAVRVLLDSGSETAYPAAPRDIQASAVESGKIKVRFLYDPYYEENGPGAADEARIYWNGGSGAVDWSTPKATVNMSGPTEAAYLSWTSGALTDGTSYKFGVRIANSAGDETQNTGTASATADTDTPDAATLEAEVV